MNELDFVDDDRPGAAVPRDESEALRTRGIGG